MKHTLFDTRSSEWIGDLAVWQRENADDNRQQLERMKRSLRRVRARELTPRQRQVMELYYERQMSNKEIAAVLGVNPSTVSRTLSRARSTLRRYLQYTL